MTEFVLHCDAVSHSQRCLFVCVSLSLLLLASCASLPGSLQCACTDCQDEHTGSQVDLCTTDGACFIELTGTRKEQMSITRGCVPMDHVISRCSDQSDLRTVVCCHESHCNGQGRARELRSVTDGNKSVNMDTGNPSNSAEEDGPEYRTAAIVTATVSVVILATVMASVVLSLTVCYCCRHGNRRSRNGAEEVDESGEYEANYGFVVETCEAIPSQGVTLDSLIQTSPSSSLSLLVQKTITRHTTLEKSLAKGQFSEVFIGVWRTERVMVKIFPHKYERVWFTETELYQLPYMRHENILCFIAADLVQRGTQMHRHLITVYHERGTLFDYLRKSTLDVCSLITMVHSIANGLTHLHMPLSGDLGQKPGIAHRNLTSKSVIVKNDGTCCIADLCLAVKDDNHLMSELRARPTQNCRYLPPEFLSEGSLVQMDIDSLRKADMYSFGLVLWEVSRRCAIQGMVEDVELPYYDVTSSDPPSLVEMREALCVQGYRPPIPDQWNRDESMRVILRTVTECWHQNSAVRLTALRVRKTLEKLMSAVKPRYDKNGKLIVTEIDRTQFHS